MLMLCSLLFADQSFDDIKGSLFKVSDLDLSHRIMASIFGPIKVGTISLLDTVRQTADTKISDVMKIFNLGVLAFAAGYISYSLGTSAINYAQHGGPMEAEKHSAWIPLRTVVGSSLLLPVAGGYTLMQAIVMSAVLAGVGLADTIWQQVVLQVDKYGVAPGKPVNNFGQILEKVYQQGRYNVSEVSSGDTIGLGDLRSIATCVSAYKFLSQSAGKQEVFGLWNGDQCGLNKGFCAGSIKNKTLCGSYSYSSDDVGFNQAVMTAVNNNIVYIDSLLNLDGNLCDTSDCDIRTTSGTSLMTLQARSFTSMLKNVIKNKEALAPAEKDSWADNAIKLGWISAGDQYRHFVRKKGAQAPVYDLMKIPNNFPFVVNKGYNLLINDFKSIKKLPAILELNNREFIAARDLDKRMNFVKQKQTMFPIDLSKSIISVLDYIAKKSSDVFVGVKEEIFNAENTIFSIRSNLRFDSIGISSIGLTIVRDNALVMIARIAGDALGIELVEPGSWYDPGVQAQYQPTLFAKKCAGGINQDGCLKKDFSGMMGSVLKYESGSRVDPMDSIADFGSNMLNTALAYFVETSHGVYSTSKQLIVPYAITSGALSFTVGVFSSMFEALKSALGQATKFIQILFQIDIKSMLAYLPFTSTIAGIFLVLGMIISVYVPFIPYMVLLFCVIGWVISVIEAMIAAPLIALGITHPQGHDLLGKSEQSVILLLGVFVRPAAILLGFIIAIYLMYVAWVLLNVGFMVSFAGYLSVIPGLHDFVSRSFVFMSLILMYSYILISLVNQVFGLTYHVPEKLMRWIGLSPEMVGVSQMMGQVQQGVQSSSEQIKEGGKQSLSNAPQFNPDIDLSDFGEGSGGDYLKKGGKAVLKKGLNFIVSRFSKNSHVVNRDNDPPPAN